MWDLRKLKELTVQLEVSTGFSCARLLREVGSGPKWVITEYSKNGDLAVFPARIEIVILSRPMIPHGQRNNQAYHYFHTFMLLCPGSDKQKVSSMP